MKEIIELLNDGVEFGMTFLYGEEEASFIIPTDKKVKLSLKEMLEQTFESFPTEGIESYEPAQKYEGIEHLKLDSGNQYISKLKKIYDQNNLTPNIKAFQKDIEAMIFYFAIFRDKEGGKYIGFKRPNLFKGLLKKKNSIIHICDDTLQLIEEDIFRLDIDFDFVMFPDNNTYILHPSGFVFISDMDIEIQRKAKEVTLNLQTTLPSINFKTLSDFVAKHRNAAKIIASLSSRTDLELTDMSLLKNYCNVCKVQFKDEDGVVTPQKKFELRFLEILDRRLYLLELIPGQQELYEAHNRKQTKA